jgi:hypothetical protein
MTFLPSSFFFLILFTGCRHPEAHREKHASSSSLVQRMATNNPYTHIGAIPLPNGYTRVPAEKNSFASWLRQVPLKEDKTVYTYNGQLKKNQYAQFAVLNIPVGNKDLQQCADAIMRLRAEYLYQQKQYDRIDFMDNEQQHYTFTGSTRAAFDKYLEKVFAYCGSLSLSRQLKPLGNCHDILPGDVLIKGGSPGHAMLVMDVAVNATGNKIYLLSQSYMPAQDIHIVVNPQDNALSPWYAVNSREQIETPEWTFKASEFRRWPGS